MCYVVKSLSKIRVAHSTCTRGLYMTPTTPTRVRGRHFGQTITTRPHKPISEAWKAVREQKTVKKWVFFSHFRDFWWFFHHWDLPEPPGGKYSIPKCSAWNFIKFETLSNQVRGHSEAQKRKNCEKNPLRFHLFDELVTTLLHLVNFSNFRHKTGYLEYVEMYHWWNFCGQGANLGQYIGLRRQKIAFGSTLLSPVLCPWRHSRSLGCENEVLNLSLCCLTSEEFGDNHFAPSPLYYGWDVIF